jgi:hypothetical protein
LAVRCQIPGDAIVPLQACTNQIGAELSGSKADDNGPQISSVRRPGGERGWCLPLGEAPITFCRRDAGGRSSSGSR